VLPGPTLVSIPNCVSISSAIFAELTADSPYTLQCALKCDYTKINRFTALL